ncbi:RHS protein [Pseudomonas sp. RIT288]|nr:RHS protein [Pseudomonas sp. RIT288]
MPPVLPPRSVGYADDRDWRSLRRSRVVVDGFQCNSSSDLAGGGRAHARKQRELGCGFTLYGWDGDNLAWESSSAQADGEPGRTVHYIFEPGTFVPVAQAVRHAPINLMGQPDYSGEYSLDEDPLWNHKASALPFDALAWYQCDHLGTPQELTDYQGSVAWAAQYKAWGRRRNSTQDGRGRMG